MLIGDSLSDFPTYEEFEIYLLRTGVFPFLVYVLFMLAIPPRDAAVDPAGPDRPLPPEFM